MTNDLYTRLQQHIEADGKKKTFAGRYRCHHLLYWEIHADINEAIAYRIMPKKYYFSENHVNSFQPESFYEGHSYTDEQKKKIREELFRPARQRKGLPKKNKYRLSTPLEFDDELLPVRAIYKNKQFILPNSKGQKRFNNNEERGGIFYLLARQK